MADDLRQNDAFPDQASKLFPPHTMLSPNGLKSPLQHLFSSLLFALSHALLRTSLSLFIKPSLSAGSPIP